jgi:hypothetical protein
MNHNWERFSRQEPKINTNEINIFAQAFFDLNESFFVDIYKGRGQNVVYEKPISNNLLLISDARLGVAKGVATPDRTYFGHNKGNVTIELPPVSWDARSRAFFRSIIAHEAVHVVDFLDVDFDYKNKEAPGYYFGDIDSEKYIFQDWKSAAREARAYVVQINYLLTEVDIDSIIDLLDHETFGLGTRFNFIKEAIIGYLKWYGSNVKTELVKTVNTTAVKIVSMFIQSYQVMLFSNFVKN